MQSKREQGSPNPEQKTLDSFHAVWKKPFQEVVQQFYKNDPSAFAELHLRVKKRSYDDVGAIRATIRELDAMWRWRQSYKQQALLEILEQYRNLYYLEQYRALCNGIPALRDELKNPLTRCHLLYNAGKVFKSPLRALYSQKPLGDLWPQVTPLTTEQFYLTTHKAKVIDPWGFHILNDYTMFSDHFKHPERIYIITQNPNVLYLIGLQHELDQYCFSASFCSAFEGNTDKPDTIKLGAESGRETRYREISTELDNDTFRIELQTRRPNGAAALEFYRKSLARGLEVALTGIARLYALGLGVEKNTEFAIELYRLAIDRGVYGALPCDSGDPQILFYSTLASGMSLNGIEHFTKHSNLCGIAYIETEYLLRMNTADPTLTATLQKFQKFALDNPDNLFETLMDPKNPILWNRLKLCLNEADYQKVVDRPENPEVESKPIESPKLGRSTLFHQDPVLPTTVSPSESPTPACK